MPETSSYCASNLKFVLIAGEQSGDNHGFALMKALHKQEPHLSFSGVGGKKMCSLFKDTYLNAEDLHMMGFSGVILALPKLYGLLKSLSARILKEKPEAVITIDFPDFNLQLSKMLRKKGYTGRLIHYISPSVWAWRKGRVKMMAKYLDLLLTIFPFEADYFRGSGLKTVYVGNPTAVIEDPPLPTKEPLIAIFPGSRLSAIKANLPLQLAAARRTGLKIAISLANDKARHLMPDDVEIVPEKERHRLMRRAQMALATSGTIALEMALRGLPTVCTYQISRLNYFVAYHLFRIRRDFYVMPNILLKRMLVPEIIGCDLEEDRVTAALELLSEEEAKKGAQELAQTLHIQDNNPSSQAAKEILYATLLST